MVNLILLIPLLISFLVSLIFTPIWIKKAKTIDFLWEDMNRPKHPRNVAGAGGLVFLFSFIIGILSYIAIRTFVLKIDTITISIFALLSTVLIAGMIGLIDDFLGWRRGGLPIWVRIVLLIFAAFPLMVINAGESTILGISIGLLYPLLLIPIGIVGASSTYNFLAGISGIEASQGIIILSALSLVVFLTGSTWLAFIGLIMVAGLLGYVIFNVDPAKIFPGDILTYTVGSMIAVMAILGNVEKIAVFFFIPYILETILKVRGKLKKSSFGKVNSDGSLEKPYDKFYGLTHVAIPVVKFFKPSRKVDIKDIVFAVNVFQILIIILGFILFGKGLVA